jgi:hypothetical protein
MSNKASLVPHNLTILPLLIFGNPFGSYDIHITRGLNYGPNKVSQKFSKSSSMMLTQLESERACPTSRGSNKATKRVLVKQKR